MASIVLYLLIFFICARLLSNYHKNSFFCICIGLLIPIVFAAGRYYVGTDFVSYLYMFDRCAGVPWDLFLESSYARSPLFFSICKVTYVFGGRVLTFGIIAALIVVLTYTTLRKQYPDIALGTSIVVFFFSFFSVSLNVCRQYIAVAIIFYGLRYIFEDKLIKFLFVVLVAVLFHKSAIIAVVMWFLWNHRNHSAVVGKKRCFLFLTVLAAILSYQKIIVVAINNISFLSNFRAYVNLSNNNASNRDFYLAIFQLVIILAMLTKMKHKDNRIDFMITMMGIALLIGITGFWHPQIKRVAFYFQMPSALVLCGYMPMCVKEREKNLMTALIILYVVLKFILTAYVLGQGNLFPYTFDMTTNFFES